MNEYQQQQYDKLLQYAKSKGWKVSGDIYINNKSRFNFECPEGHIREKSYNEFMQGRGCAKCSGKCSEQSKEKFIKRIQELGGKVIGEYIQKNIPVECLCKEGHKCFPRPNGVRNGQGMCQKCAGNCSEQARDNFYTQIEKLGGKVIGDYQSSNTPVECLCKEGHKCFPRPNDTSRGIGICLKCVNRCSEQAKENFYKRIEELGGKVIGEYTKSHVSVECLCKEGHKCFPNPSTIQHVLDMCLKCSGYSPEQSKENFYKRIEELGAKVIGEYLTTKTPIECLCKEGHKCFPNPGQVIQGHGICKKCVGKCPEQARENFNKRIEELGGKVLGEYINTKTPVKCLCSQNHICNPYPSQIHKNSNWIPCNLCFHKTESIVNNFLTPLYTFQREAKFDWCRNIKTNWKLSFDFFLEKEKIFIEVDGFHHFKDCDFRYTKAEDIQERDIYKMKCAIQNGYKVLRINQEDIMNENFIKVLNVSASWEAAICIGVQILQKGNENIVYLSSDENLYVNHKLLYDST